MYMLGTALCWPPAHTPALLVGSGRSGTEGPGKGRAPGVLQRWVLRVAADVLPRASDHIHHPVSGPLDLTTPEMCLLSQPGPLLGPSAWVLPLRGSDTPAYSGSGT